MKISRRTSLVILFLGIVLLLAIGFWPFVLNTFVTPLAVVFWMFWRVLLSIDQAIYWGFTLLAVLFYIYVRTPRAAPDFELASAVPSHAILESIQYWRTSILLNSDEIDRPNILKKNLGKMLATIYTLKQPGTTFVDTYDRLRKMQIPLPETIFTFLFADENGRARRSLRQAIGFLLQTPGRWFRHWTGRDVAEYFRTVEQVITFMESLMEEDHDDTPGSLPEH